MNSRTLYTFDIEFHRFFSNIKGDLPFRLSVSVLGTQNIFDALFTDIPPSTALNAEILAF